MNAKRKNEFATGDNPDAQNAFDEFHGFIDYAKDEITRDFGGGHLFDMHTNAHSASWAEIGQLGSKSALNRGDDAIQNNLGRSSVRQMVEGLGRDYIEITKGQTSLGGFLQSRGIKSVPSPRHPSSGAEGFFKWWMEHGKTRLTLWRPSISASG